MQMQHANMLVEDSFCPAFVEVQHFLAAPFALSQPLPVTLYCCALINVLLRLNCFWNTDSAQKGVVLPCCLPCLRCSNAPPFNLQVKQTQ